MNPDLFKTSTAGHCIKSQRGYWAFIPNALPPQIELNAGLIKLLSVADQYIGKLSGAAQLLLNPHLLIHPFVRREAVLSSRIENTQSGLDDLFLFEADETEPLRIPDVREIANYVQAMNYGLLRLKTLPISNRLVCEIHKILMTGVCGDHATPGEMRRSQNWIGPPNCTLEEATFVPPPVEEMKSALSNWEKYLHSDPSEPVLIQCALIHYQFETIHPFIDGNGRIGRLLIPFLLCERDVLSQPLLYLSAFFERYREEYYQRLLAVSQKGDWIGWIDYFLRGVCAQSQDALKNAQKLINLREQYRTKVMRKRAPQTALRIIDHIFSNPMISISGLSKKWDIPYMSIQRGVDYLIKEGLLEEVTGQQRNRIYVANELYNLYITDRTKSLVR